MDLKTLVAKHRDRIITIRRDLHQIPETAYTEENTSAYVAECLRRESLLEVQTGLAQYGIAARLKTGKPGPTLMVRADMDALPIQEETGHAFASGHAGRMHACGHDGHMAMVLGAVSVLTEIKDALRGTIIFIFQPAEEDIGGAKPMIDAGVLDDPRVDYAVGCHLWPALPEGQIGVRAGPLMAAMDRFELTIIGKSGHGAMPHQCVDALDVGCQVINSLQRVVSRQMNPLCPTVLTIGSFQAGTAFNIIPGKAQMSGTTRTFDRDIWESWEQRLRQIVGGLCDAMGASYALNYQRLYPPTVNDAWMADVVRRCAGHVVSPANVIEPEQTMTGEDMAFYLERVPGCFFFLGAGREGAAPLHNAHFDFNEAIMLSGVETYCRVALELLSGENSTKAGN
ncbi:amidohydrolase [candidate division KSB3 bacterium]|uniref:Amidohydrolase n=1 Tax=candidate division KSB3 bacterium TaxID=2044937 RepID=A0A9D5JUX2_9BACT|nr:amidohydrolase [candidate division KSB3 bacterium]MBD3324588.1 amidohydrolase [candidate division KSB3 bacterium]